MGTKLHQYNGIKRQAETFLFWRYLNFLFLCYLINVNKLNSNSMQAFADDWQLQVSRVRIQNGKLQYKHSTSILICEVSGAPCFYRQTGSGSYYYDWHNEKHDAYCPTVFINPSILCTYVIPKNCLPPTIKDFLFSERIPCQLLGGP